MTITLIDRLASISRFSGIPRKELKWLAEHGRFEVFKAGTIIGPKGKPINHLWIVLSGKIAIRVDRGAGPRLVTEWHSGEVSGMLPYSRMSGPPGDNYIEEEAELLSIDANLFPEMIHLCPSFTAYTVHSMLDRARDFNTSDLQDEKMISLGKLAAGLAHELNNPASAMVRNASILEKNLNQLNTVSRALGASRLTSRQINKIENVCKACQANTAHAGRSAIEIADKQDQINEWLSRLGLTSDLENLLSNLEISIKQLDGLADTLPRGVLQLALQYIIASCHTQSLAGEIGVASTRIYKVVDAVKKFTFMDQRGDNEVVDIQSGIRDTISILIAKATEKNADITYKSEVELPRVAANGNDLNQIWFCLLDNALDAISDAGHIRIRTGVEPDRVTVSIIDDGPGIPPDMIPKIFDPFYTTKPPGQGTGLGLDITRRLLRRYHGDITVKSRPGRTEFKVSLITENPVDGARRR